MEGQSEKESNSEGIDPQEPTQPLQDSMEDQTLSEPGSQQADSSIQITESIEPADAQQELDAVADGEALKEPDLTSEKTEAETKEVVEDDGPELDTSEAAKPVEEKNSAPVKKPAQQSLWSKIKSWFTRRPKHGAIPHKEPIKQPAKAWGPEDRETALASIRQLEESIAARNLTAESLDRQIANVESEVRKLEDWIDSMSRSYFNKVEKQMSDYLSKARQDVAEYERLVSSMNLPEQGRLSELRRKFHKYLLINITVFFVPTFLLFFIPWFAGANLTGWISAVFSSPIYLGIVLTVGALVFGILMLLRRVLGKERVTGRRSFGVMSWTLGIPLGLYAIYYFRNFLNQFVVPVIEDLRPATLWVLAILFIFALLAGLIIYYQDWSVFRRQVTEELAGLDNVVAGYVKTKQEIARLEFLYEQTTVWFKLLAHNIYRPWKIHPDWKAANPAQKSSESFPMALRVAQAVEDDLAESAQLRRAIANRLLVQGWRSEAFDKSLSQIGQHLGYDSSKVNAELLDSDLPHQPNNSRGLVLEFFEHSADTAAEGILDMGKNPSSDSNPQTKVPPSDVYLVEVARELMSYLTEKTQGMALAEARPSVQHVVVNPLADLLDPGEAAEHLETSGWHEFLSSGLGIDEPTQPPIGLLAFTDEGLKAKSADTAQSKILVPERAASALPSPKASSVEVVSIPDEGKQHPAEVIVRLDVAGPLPFRFVELIQNSVSVYGSQVVEEQNDDL